jgi:8-oxo-dGTP pyrophosphatase MutT (NUDIX family)
VLLIDEHDQLLLIRVHVPRTVDRTIWLTPGGGLEPGEAYDVAARRELREETGLEGVTLSPCVWQRRHVFEWDAEQIEAREQFYVGRVGGTPAVHEAVPNDTEDMLEFRWWSLEEIQAAADTEIFVPRALPKLLAPILRGAWPVPPLQIGA